MSLTGQLWVFPRPGSYRDVHQDPGLTKGDSANGSSQQMPFTGEVFDMENIIIETNGKQKTEAVPVLV